MGTWMLMSVSTLGKLNPFHNFGERTEIAIFKELWMILYLHYNSSAINVCFKRNVLHLWFCIFRNYINHLKSSKEGNKTYQRERKKTMPYNFER